jgi:gluconate kinase
MVDGETSLQACGTTFSGKTTLARRLCQAIDCEYISLDEIIEDRGLYGETVYRRMNGSGVTRLHCRGCQRQRAKGETLFWTTPLVFGGCGTDIVDRAQENGCLAQIVYLDILSEEIRRRVAENSTLPRRRAIAPDLLAEHLRTFEKPNADEAAIVLDSPQSISDWIASLREGTSR